LVWIDLSESQKNLQDGSIVVLLLNLIFALALVVVGLEEGATGFHEGDRDLGLTGAITLVVRGRGGQELVGVVHGRVGKPLPHRVPAAGPHRLLVAKGDERRLFELSVHSRSAASLAMSVLCVRTAAAAGAGPWPGGEQERADLDPAERARRRRVGAAPATSHARRQPRGHACSCAARP